MSIVTPMPHVILHGINDRSAVIQEINENIPAHFPLCYTLAGWGSYDGEVISSEVIGKYGSIITDPNSPYGTHQSLLAGELLGVGNSVMLKRVKLENAKQAMIRLSVEVATFLKPVYQRDSNNNIVYATVQGVRVPVVESYINGTRLIWHTSQSGDQFYPSNFKGFGKGITLSNFRNGGIVGDLPDHYPKHTLSHGSATLDPTGPITTLGSTIYPILDVNLIYDGTRGNNIGLVFEDITRNDSNNIALSASIGSYVYGLKVVETNPANGQRKTILNQSGESSSNIVFGESVYDPRTNVVLSIKDVLEENYELFEKVHLYSSNYDKVMNDIMKGRTSAGIVVSGEDEFIGESTESLFLYGLVDILKGQGSDGNEYSSFTTVDGPAFGGVSLINEYPLCGIGGSDGLVYDETGAPDRLENLRLFDEAVRHELVNFGELGFAFNDMAKYPITTLWDSGFSLDTKKAMCSILARRRDIFVALATFTVADYVEVEDIIDNRISCAGASPVAAFRCTAQSAIEIDGELFTVNADDGLKEFGDKLTEYGVRLMVAVIEPETVAVPPSTVLPDLYSEVCAMYGLENLVHYTDVLTTYSDVERREFVCFIENVNPTKETRIRLRPGTNEYFPDKLFESDPEYSVYARIDEFDRLRYQNRTIGLVEAEEVNTWGDLSYQVTVCLSKYIPRAISCAGATPEMAVILDNAQRYALTINGVTRGVGITVKEIANILTSIRLDVKTYARLPTVTEVN